MSPAPKRRGAPSSDLAVLVSADGVRAPLTHAVTADVVRGVLRAERIRHAFISVVWIAPAAMARINARHLGHRGATDVIAFALGRATPRRGSAPVVGDIYICPAVARTNAARFGASLRDEAARLVMHGVLHVVGWDHPSGARRFASPMWARQESLLTRWKRA